MTQTDGDLLLIIQIPDNIKMQQDVVLALMRSSTLFISYLSEWNAAETPWADDVAAA